MPNIIILLSSCLTSISLVMKFRIRNTLKHILLIVFWGVAMGVYSQNRLDSIATKYLKKYQVPGLAISMIKEDTVYYGTAGVERCGSSDKITLQSKFQIGSNAKAITATLAAILVEGNYIQWDTELLELVPELKGGIREEYESIDLENLLSHRGFVQPFEESSSSEWKGMRKSFGKADATKYQFAEYALNLPPKKDTENNHSYSNGGFVIAALMLERCTDKSWADLVQLFNMQFGVEVFVGFPSQENPKGTHGHKKSMGKYKVIEPTDEESFQFDFSPAGNLAINIEDLAKYISFHLDGLLGIDNVLKSSTYKHLHYGLEDYALGWYNGKIGDSEERFSYHGGSLGTFSSAIMLSPDREIAIMILVNSDDDKANQLKTELREELWGIYGKKVN